MKTNKVINFTYTRDVGEDVSEINSKIFDSFQAGSSEGESSLEPQKRDISVVVPNILFKNKVTKIESDDTIIEFKYINARTDLKFKNLTYADYNYNAVENGSMLKNIFIKDKYNVVICNYEFEYNYFNSGCDSNNPKCNRLKLEKIIKNFPDQSETHLFTYYEDTNLPPVNYGKKDAFGYSNGFGNFPLLSDIITKPKLYFYAENGSQIGETSYYSPFYIPQNNPAILNGEDMSASFLSTRAWSLKSIQYPTKGFQEFIYELNSFKWKNNEFNGGGLRIKEINLKGINNIDKKIAYNYNDSFGTTGSLLGVPLFTDSQFCFNTPTTNLFVTVKSEPELYLTKGSNVGYEKVTVTDNTFGKIEKFFENPKTIPIDQVKLYPQNNINNNPFYLDATLFYDYNFKDDKDFARGLISKEKTFDINNILIKEIEFGYSYSTNNPLNIYTDPNYPNGNYTRYFKNSYDCGYSPQQYSQPWFGSCILGYNNWQAISRKLFSYSDNNLIQKTEKLYFSSGINENQTIYTYNNNFNTISSVKSKNSKNDIIEQKYFYPQDFNYYSSLVAQTRYNEVVKSETYNNGVKIAESQKKYATNLNTSNLCLNIENHSRKGVGVINLNGDDDKIIDYTRYDSVGNVIEYVSTNGITTVII